MARNYAALPWEYKREMSALNDAEFGRLCRALLEYSESGTPIALCGNERIFCRTCHDAGGTVLRSPIPKRRRKTGKMGLRAGGLRKPKKTQRNPT
mgnify:CR=1 FL=1